MRNIFKIFGVLLVIFIILLTMGFGVYAETEGMTLEGENPVNPGVSIEVETNKVLYISGEAIEYSIKVINTGDVTLNDLTLSDELLGEKNIGKLDVQEELIFDESYTIPIEHQEGAIENKIQVLGMLDGIEIASEGSFSVGVEKAVAEEEPPGQVQKADVAEENPLADVCLMSIQPDYPADTDVFRLTMKSTNEHTEAIFTWMNGGEIYIAFISLKEIIGLTYNDSQLVIGSDVVIERASDESTILKVNGREYGTVKDVALKGDTSDKYWSVVKISGKTLTSPFKITVDTSAGGHNLKGVDVYIDSYLEVFHKYDGETAIKDADQSGSLDQNLSYSVYPVYKMDGKTYELTNIEVYYNGIKQPNIGVGDLSEGRLSGTVTPIQIEIGKDIKFTASAKITFIYERIDDAELTIKKVLHDDKLEDASREFDIFIYGPENKVYVVTLTPGESKTLKRLKYGTYTIRETIPMNFKLIGISPNSILLDKNNKIGSVTVTNKRSNDGWFHDDDEKKNNFTVITARGE